jgi:hypothetical protein
LCDMQLVGRAPEAALSSDRREIPKVTQLHGWLLLFYTI